MSSETILSQNPKIFIKDNFLEDDKCDYIISTFKNKLARSKVLVDGVHKENKERSSYSAALDHSHDAVHGILAGVSKLLKHPINNLEAPQLTRYVKGDFYNAHFDAFVDQDKNYQRLRTCIIYLQTTKGGETYFDSIDIKVIGLKGRVLVFDNCFDGTNLLNPGSLHSGLRVDEGEKFILTIWASDKPFF